MDIVSIGGYPWLTYAVIRFLDALFTGLMLIAVIAVAVRFLGVRRITFKVDVDGRDQDNDPQ